MKRTAKKLMSLGLAIALVLAGNAYTASTADAKGKGNAGKHACSQEKQKDSKSKKNKKDKKSKKHPIIFTVSGLEKNEKYTVTVTGIKTKNEKKYGFVTTTFSTKE